MFYYESNEHEGRTKGIIAALVYIAFWGALMLIVSFNFEERETGEGILVNFGDMDEASGIFDPANFDRADYSFSSGNPVTDPDAMATQDFEDAPEIAAENDESTRPVTENARPSNDDSRQPVEQPAPEREVNRRALFPGRTEGSESVSEGTGQGQGNQGSPQGSPEGSHDGTGTGGGGTGFSLAGRSVVGALPQPQYGSNKSGRVIIEIVVDSGGNVVGAQYRAVGSTTNDSELVNAALRAARQSKFNAIDSDDPQRGTITYNFRLK